MNGQGCDCSRIGASSFIQVAKETDLIVQAKILEISSFDSTKSISPERMTVEIIEAIKGNSDAKEIVILGYGANDCYDLLNSYKVGATYIFSLSSIDKNIKTISYALFSCGHHSLVKKGNIVTGVITKEMSKSDQKNYGKLLEKLSKLSYDKKNQSEREKIYSKMDEIMLTLRESLNYISFKKLLNEQ